MSQIKRRTFLGSVVGTVGALLWPRGAHHREGQTSDVAVYNRALTEKDIRRLYHAETNVS